MAKMLSVIKFTFFFFSKHINVFAIFCEQSFNDTLTNDIVSFKQLGPDHGSIEVDINISCVAKEAFVISVTVYILLL